jgi:hypothetical protein
MAVCSRYGINLPVEIEENLLKCIKDKHDIFYATDPKRFIMDAYFDCVGSIQKRLRQAMEIVFGTEHEYLSLFFDKVDKYSTYDLRSRLAHGSFTILDSEHKELIEKKLPELKHIAYEFILRLSTGTAKDQIPKKIKPSQSFSIRLASPRGTGVTSTLDVFPNKDWRIKPEWLF